jgi:RNA polymerase sigma factor (sigma-70 family)
MQKISSLEQLKECFEEYFPKNPQNLFKSPMYQMIQKLISKLAQGTRIKSEDIIYEVFIEAAKHIKRGKKIDKNSGGWIYRVALARIKTKVKEHGEQKKLAHTHVIPPEIEDDASNNNQLDYTDDTTDLRYEKVNKAMSNLSSKDREILELSVIKGWPHNVIAEHLSISEVASRRRKSRALEKLNQGFHCQ